MIMKSIYSKIAAVVLLSITGLTACTNDLNQEPLADTTLTAEKAWIQPGSYDKYMSKLYSALAISGNDGPGSGDIVGSDQGEATLIRSYFNLQELPTDEAAIAWGDDGLNSLTFNSWSATNRFIMLSYDRCELINAWVNEFLIQTTDEKLSARGASTALIDSVKLMRNEAHVIRAFSYSLLMDLYANVPFVDENTGVGAFLPEQKGRDFLFPYIESELKAAIANLPEKSDRHYGMANKFVADMILANLYMNAEVYGQGNRYNDAIACLNDIIDNGGYTLEQKYGYNFNADNYKSKEIIFPIIYDSQYAQSYGGTMYLMAGTFGTDMAPSDNYGLNGSWSGLRVKEDIVNLFSEGDQRAMFFTGEGTDKPRTKSISNTSDYYQGYPSIKYQNLNRDGSAAVNKNFSDVDFPFYRLADAYLLYIEAVKRGGNGDAAKAVRLWNALQLRAFGNNNHDIASLSDITLNDILDERGRELYWEAHRRTDLIRFNNFTDNKNWSWKGGSQAGVQKIDDKYKIYPLPSTDLSANPNLKQNPGY